MLYIGQRVRWYAKTHGMSAGARGKWTFAIVVGLRKKRIKLVPVTGDRVGVILWALKENVEPDSWLVKNTAWRPAEPRKN